MTTRDDENEAPSGVEPELRLIVADLRSVLSHLPDDAVRARGKAAVDRLGRVAARGGPEPRPGTSADEDVTLQYGDRLKYEVSSAVARVCRGERASKVLADLSGFCRGLASGISDAADRRDEWTSRECCRLYGYADAFGYAAILVQPLERRLRELRELDGDGDDS